MIKIFHQPLTLSAELLQDKDALSGWVNAEKADVLSRNAPNTLLGEMQFVVDPEPTTNRVHCAAIFGAFRIVQ
jgi:hypothetical protein